MALTDNLVSYWKLDESSGNASDSVGANTLTNTNGTYTASKINNGWVGNGSSAKLVSGSNVGITGSGARSYSFWVKPTSITSTYYLIDTGEATAAKRFLIYLFSSGKIGVNTWEAQDMSTNDSQLSTSVWKHVVVTYAGGASLSATSTKIYVDGVAVATSNPSTSTLATTNAAQYIGSSLLSDNWYAGGIDEVGIWSRALTSTEVTSLYNLWAGIQYPFITGPGAGNLFNFF